MANWNFRRLLALMPVALWALAAQSFGGGALPAAPTDLPATASNAAALYRTTAAASFESGCFPPCQCITHYQSPLRGTLTLVPTGTTNAGRLSFAVRDVNWLVTFGGADTRVTGSGTFEITHPAVVGPLPHTQRMVLALSIGGQPAQVFDSGVDPVVQPFPALDVTISMNNMVCIDTVFRVAMSVVPAAAVRPFRLQDSMYQEGCFIGCACPITSRPMGGTFGLVALPGAGAVAPSPNAAQEWGVVNINWAVANASPSPSLPPANSSRITGVGIYKRTPSAGALPVLAHRLWLDVSVPATGIVPPPAGPRVAFDSGLVPAPAAFPNIDIAAADNMFQCFNRVFDLHARPIPHTTPITD